MRNPRKRCIEGYDESGGLSDGQYGRGAAVLRAGPHLHGQQGADQLHRLPPQGGLGGYGGCVACSHNPVTRRHPPTSPPALRHIGRNVLLRVFVLAGSPPPSQILAPAHRSMERFGWFGWPSVSAHAADSSAKLTARTWIDPLQATMIPSTSTTQPAARCTRRCGARSTAWGVWRSPTTPTPSSARPRTTRGTRRCGTSRCTTIGG